MRIGRGLAGVLGAACAAASTHAACPADQQYTHSFAGTTPNPTQLNYANTYQFAADATGAGLNPVNYTVSFAQNGMTATGLSMGTLPQITSVVNGGTNATALLMGGSWGAAGRTPYTSGTGPAGNGLTGNTRVLVTTLTFPTLVRDVTFTVADIDFATDSYRDWIRFVGVDGGNSYLGAVSAGASTTARAGPQTTPVAIVAGEGMGIGSADNATSAGNLTVTFAQPVRSVQLRYGNYPWSGTDNLGAGNQFYALLGVSWCPLPLVTMTKSSAPWTDPVNGRTNPKAIPGGDVVYTLTVRNANRSTAEAPVLTDILPATLTFFNGDMNDAAAGTANYEFDGGTSGVTLPAGGITYSNSAGAPHAYGYTPTAGYDTNVKALRIQTTGTMAPNTSFTVKFRAQVKL